MTAAARLGDDFPSVLAAAQAGAAWAFERLWQVLSGPVAGYLRVQGSPEPDDVTSEVFLSVFKGIARFEGDEDQFRAWVFTIAHRRLSDERRRAGRRAPAAPLDDGPDGATADAVDVAEDAIRRLATVRVEALCQRLVPDQRDVLLLRLVGGLTVDEVAATVGKSRGAVKALQRRGLAAIQRIFECEGVPL